MKNDLSTLRSLIFESDNQACFIEREKILARLESEITEPEPSTRAADLQASVSRKTSLPHTVQIRAVSQHSLRVSRSSP
ncbi:MAG: hypothetical protein IJW03_01115 [Clostridia bacterium]|nr:hypothetical protein [Clostridia bacterium]